MTPKSETIDRIRKLNPTADPGFLAEFSNVELCRYLDRLNARPKARPLQDESGASGSSPVAWPARDISD